MATSSTPNSRRKRALADADANAAMAGRAPGDAAPPHPGDFDGRPALPPLALYAHFPWCVKKCPYCDFNSHPLRGGGGGIDQTAYIDALLRDLDADLARYGLDGGRGGGRELASIFFGGGTPSLFAADAIAQLLRGIAARLPLARGVEITMEVNPGGVEHGDFAAYRAAGVNRLSLGAQSFDAAQLAKLGRIHSADETRRAVEAARAAGFDNFNLDLMHGLPGQTAAGALADLDAALALAPAHLSLYQLTIEPHTEFHRRPPRLPDADRILDMQRSLTARAARAGYRRYEVSAFARPGRRCRHNLNYWRFGDYLGIGAGAHGKITAAGAPMTVERYWKVRHPGRFLAAAGDARALAGTRQIIGGDGGGDLLFEFLMNALRLTDGVSVSLARARTGRPAAAVIDALAEAAARRWVLVNRGRIRCSAAGYRLLDEILQALLPDDGARN